MTHYFGAHTVDVGGIHMAARRAGRSGMRALQIFTAVPKFYNEKVSVRPERAEQGLMKELDRANALGIGAVCFHPGANPDKVEGVKRIARAITRALETVESDTTRLLVENTAGAGNTIARTAEGG